MVFSNQLNFCWFGILATSGSEHVLSYPLTFSQWYRISYSFRSTYGDPGKVTKLFIRSHSYSSLVVWTEASYPEKHFIIVGY